MIVTKTAKEIQVGEVMSTNGARIESAVLCQTVGHPEDDEVCICFSFEDGSQRFEYVSPDLPIHIWIEDSAS